MTEEDKQWFSGLIQSLQTQIQGLDTKVQGIESRMARLESRMAKFETRMDGFDARMESFETRMLERIERTETRLLTAFHDWASPMEARVSSHSAALRAIDMQMESNLKAIKARLDELERGRRQ